MIVDADSDQLQAYKKKYSRFGYEVSTVLVTGDEQLKNKADFSVQSLQEVTDLVRQETPDYLLTGNTMPALQKDAPSGVQMIDNGVDVINAARWADPDLAIAMHTWAKDQNGCIPMQPPEMQHAEGGDYVLAARSGNAVHEYFKGQATSQGVAR